MKDIALAIHSLLQSDLTGYTGPEHNVFAASYCLDEVVRKLEPDDSSAVDTLTWEAFKAVNNRCASWCMPSDPACYFLELARSFCHASFDIPDNDFHLEHIAQGMNLGPGVNIGGHPSCSYPLKISKGLCGRANLLSIFDVLCRVTPYRFFPGSRREVRESSSVSFVPKTTRTSRMICTEPTVNMLFQRGVSLVIENALLRHGIDLSVQPDRNSRLARIGSLDGSYATIDLSSASDSLSLSLARFLLPARAFAWIVATRSPSTTYKGETIPLNMVSTMGNGYTFSLQTLVFYSIAASCCEGERVSVFGDDIIVPTKYASRVLKVLGLAGFHPNPKKTFLSGPFRESCGTDYYNGFDVRPHYIKRLASIQDLCVHINRIRRWSFRTGIPIPLTGAYFESLIERFHIIRTHPDENDDAGIKDSSCPDPFHKYHFKEGPKHSHHIIDSVWFYYAYQYKPRCLRFTTKGWSGHMADAFKQLSDDLLLSSFLRGTIRENCVTFRDPVGRRPRYEVVRRFSTTPW